MEGYRAFHHPRQRLNRRAAGGLAFFVKENLQAEQVVVPDTILTSELTIEVSAIKVNNIIVILLYRPPDGSISDFLISLRSLLA